MAIGNDDEVCRDFQKGNCTRGSKCKFVHPKIDVCRDFQTKGCNRPNCKFEHVGGKQEVFYESKGNLPSRSDLVLHNLNLLNNNNIDLKNIYGKRMRPDSITMVPAGLTPTTKKAFIVETDKPNDLCRDFEKGNCSRGSRCKYFHPKMRVCRDFQNQKCERETCRFLHLTKEEETSYDNSGKIPDHVDADVAKKNRIIDSPVTSSPMTPTMLTSIGGGLAALTNQNEISATQICHDFEKGNCNRAARCKYYHATLNVCRDFQNNKCERDNCRFLHLSRDEEDVFTNSGKIPDHVDESKAKKNKIINLPSPRAIESTTSILTKGYNLVPTLSAAVPQSVLQENEVLKLKIAELQQQITDLHQMNDTLYQQNMTYRKSRISV